MIQLQNITVSFGEQKVLDGFSLTLPDYGRIALMGPSGCGKSTLLRAVSGLIPYTGTMEGLQNRRIGLLFQEDRLLPQSNALVNVIAALPDDLPKKQKQAKAAELLRQCELPEEAFTKYPAELSGGMKKRVAIARLLAFQCDVWLLDEPFRGLDMKSRDSLMELLLSLSADKLMVIVTHDAYEASGLGEQIIPLSGPPLKVEH